MSRADAEYVLERIQSMLSVLATRADPEGHQAQETLRDFRSRVEYALSGSEAHGDLETQFYQLVGSERTLGTVFLDAMEADVNRLARDRPSGGPRSALESA